MHRKEKLKLKSHNKSYFLIEVITKAGLTNLFYYILRYMFKLDPDLMVKYPFYQDEWNKISYDDYSGQYPDHPPNSWFVVFR